MKKITYIFPCLILFCSVNVFSDSEDQILLDKLTRYTQESQSVMHERGFLGMKDYLTERDVDVEEFAHQMLDREFLVDYWYEAIFLLAAAKYIEDPLSLANELIDRSKRNVQINSVKYQQFLNACITVLSGMFGPKIVDNPELMNVIVGYADDVFENKEVMDPTYWIKYYRLEDLAAQPKDKISIQQRHLLGYTRERSRLLSKLAARIYYVTHSEKYLDLMKEYQNSSDLNVSHFAKFLMSDDFKKEWESGRLDLFARESRKIEMSDEEKEEQQKNIEKAIERINERRK